MKRLFNVIVLTLAANFLAVAGGVGWLYKEGKLTHENISSIKEVLYPKPKAEVPASQPSGDPTTQPIMQLEELLTKASGRSATEQVEFIQHTFDAQMAMIDRRQRELNDLQRQVELSKQQMSKDRVALDGREKALADREQQSTRLASDKGFQDSLALYKTMPPKQVKDIFLTLDDQTVMNYLQAMEPRMASKIIKEFKGEDTARIQKILERMRAAQASVTSPKEQ